MKVRSGMMVWMLALAACAGAATAPATRPAVQAPMELRIDGEGLTAATITPEQLAAKTHVEVKVKEHSGAEATYSGVPLRELLLAAGAPLGDEHLRGKALALYVVAVGADGYEAVIALPEIDPTFTDQTILVADKRDGEPLGASEGPFKLIVPGDKKQARWVRLLKEVRVERAK